MITFDPFIESTIIMRKIEHSVLKGGGVLGIAYVTQVLSKYWKTKP